MPVASCSRPNLFPEAQIAINYLPVLRKLRSLQLVIKPREPKNCRPSNDWPSVVFSSLSLHCILIVYVCVLSCLIYNKMID